MNKSNTNHLTDYSPCTCVQGPTQCVEYFIFLVKMIYSRETGGINAKGHKLHNMQSQLIIECSHSDLLFSTVFLACENIHFSSLFNAGDVSHGGTSATQRQKFHNDDHANQCLHNKFGSHWVPINLSNFTCLLVSFGKVSCSSADELHQNSNASSQGRPGFQGIRSGMQGLFKSGIRYIAA